MKKSNLFIFAFTVCAVFLLSPDYSSAQGTSIPLSFDYSKFQNISEEEWLTPQGRCNIYSNGKMNTTKPGSKEEYFIERDTENNCLIRAAISFSNGKKWDTTISYVEVYYTDDKKELCQKSWSEKGDIGPAFCMPVFLAGLGKMGTIPSSGGWSEEAKLPEPIIIKKGEYYEHDFSQELINLLDPRDQSKPYTFSLNTMGGFPPMGLVLGLDGVLKGTPVGKGSHFEACVKNSSGRSVCKVLNIKLEKDASDKPELDIMESIKSAFESDKYTEINYKDLIYGERGQIKSGIHERVTIVRKDGSIIEMDKNSSLINNSENELTTDRGKFKFNYEKSQQENLTRQVNTPNGTIRIKGTQFTVENDSSGTNIAVIEGTVLVSEAKGKKEVEINEGQFAFLKDGILLEEPQSFEPEQLDRWWEEEDVEQSDGEKDVITLVVLGIIAFIFLIVVITKKLMRKKTMTEEEKKADAIERKIRVILSLIIGAGSLFLMLIFYLSPKFLPQPVLDAIISLVFPGFGLTGLMMGLLEAKLSKKILSAFMIALNIISVILWIVFIMPRY